MKKINKSDKIILGIAISLLLIVVIYDWKQLISIGLGVMLGVIIIKFAQSFDKK